MIPISNFNNKILTKISTIQFYQKFAENVTIYTNDNFTPTQNNFDGVKSTIKDLNIFSLRKQKLN